MNQDIRLRQHLCALRAAQSDDQRKNAVAALLDDVSGPIACANAACDKARKAYFAAVRKGRYASACKALCKAFPANRKTPSFA